MGKKPVSIAIERTNLLLQFMFALEQKCILIMFTTLIAIKNIYTIILLL